MIRKSLRLIVLFIILLSSLLRADEGMWIPILIEKFNIEIMQEKGFKLSAEDIYSVNQASMKDAVMIFGGGCTAELISDKGLLITNHHCGYRAIQSHSTVDHDYLTNGFWAMSQGEELANPGLTVTFLKWMKDVTEEVLEGIEDGMSEEDMSEIKQKNIIKIKEEAIEGTHFTAQVKPFYYGNQYFLFVNETYKDVRLVGAPPSAIGKFGGDTDNWMWPRHTGDAEGNLIGINFDRAWEGVMSDLMFNPKQCRNISLDIRYALFIIDKFAGAGYLLDEMILVE